MSASGPETLVSMRRVLNGRYAVGEVIGWGGMAKVHAGRDMCSGRSVAIKVLRQDMAHNPFFHSRFRREAQVLAGLHHPTIVALYDSGVENLDDGPATATRVPFIVLEHVAGQSLQDLLKDGRPDVHEAIRCQLAVLSALEHSHAAGIVHRDIKPANVMITSEGVVKVVDFGIARAHGDPDATMTQHEAFLGTPSYISPEQVRGGTGDARSDLYSAGCLLYELLTGRPPFVGDDPVSIAYQHVHEEPDRVSTHRSDLTPALDVVLVKALAKDQKDRFQTAQAFSEALQFTTNGIPHDATTHERCA